MKQDEVKSFFRINPQSSSLHRETRQFVGLLEHDLMTAIHKILYAIRGKTSYQFHDLERMSSNDTAGVFFLPIETTMNSVRYRKMLEDKAKNSHGYS